MKTKTDTQEESIKKKPGKELTVAQAEPSITSVRQPVFSDTVAYTLTPNRLYSIVKNLKVGDARDYLTLAEELEIRDTHYRSVLDTRKSQVANLSCHIIPASDEEKDTKIAETVENYILKAPWFKGMEKDLLDALGKGYAVCEIIWGYKNGLWVPADVVYRDPRYFKYDMDTMSTLMLDEAGQEVPLMPNKFVVHEPKLKSGLQLLNGLALVCAYYHLIKSLDIAGWAALAEVYGYPLRIGRYGRNASEKDKQVLKKAIANLGKDVGAVIPESMKVEIVNGMTGTGNITLYETLADWIDKQISKAVLGQTMSTDAEGGQYKGDLHNEIRLELKRDDAGELAATIQRDLIVPFVNFNFGKQEQYPQLQIVIPEPGDIQLLVNALEKLVPMGLKVKADDMYSKLNLQKPKDTDELLVAPSASMYPMVSENQRHIETNSQNQPEDKKDEFDTLEDEELGDWEEVMNPFQDALSSLISKCTSYAEVIQRLPELLKKFGIHEKDVAEALAKATFKARALGAGEYDKD